MKVLSLFDGISCGMVALERAGIRVDRYVAYEIDEDAIKVSKYNYPLIEQKGDVFLAEYKEGEFDLLIGGSPCTYWSIAKAGYGRETSCSGVGFELFMQYVRALKEAKPRWFLYENNESMSDEIKQEITKQLGVEPVAIDSADFSAQRRKRLYWTNIPIEMNWKKSPLLFEDIMEHDVVHKSRNFEKWKDTIQISKDGMNVRYDTSGKGHYGQGNRARNPAQKWNTLTSAGSNTKNDIWVSDFVSWHLTPTEMERLQTLPDGYTKCLKSDIKTMRVCGNGWTVDVIAHIFSALANMRAEAEEEVSFEEIVDILADPATRSEEIAKGLVEGADKTNSEAVRKVVEYMEKSAEAPKEEVSPVLKFINEMFDAAEKKVEEEKQTEAEFTDLSDAPKEIKEEIMNDAEQLERREGTEAKTATVHDFNAAAQLKKLADERKALANINPDSDRFADDIRALEYAINVLDVVGL